MTLSVQEHPQTGWVGWLVFASVMLWIVGMFQAIAGLTAIFKDQYYLVPSSGLIVQLDYTAWGWVHLALGFLMVAAGVSLFSGHMFGRVVGVVVAAVSAIVNLAFLGAYPIWSMIIIALDVIVIYAIVVHGREVTS